MASRLDLAEVKRGLPVPALQHGRKDVVLRFQKNLLQPPLNAFRHAIHGKTSRAQCVFLPSNASPS